MELWNEPWEGLSISGWGADIPRYRDLYTRMAQGVVQARKQGGIQVLLGGCCSSMNTDDKLFCDGTDTFLKWLDFISIHYQPMGAMPALIPEWMTRKNPNGPVRVWDTESWVANSDDRVAAVVASMLAQGQTRCSGVLHDAVYEVPDITVQTERGPVRQRGLQVYSIAASVAALEKFIGERTFHEILFKNGLPWVFVFNGLPQSPEKPANARRSAPRRERRLLRRGRRHDRRRGRPVGCLRTGAALVSLGPRPDRIRENGSGSPAARRDAGGCPVKTKRVLEAALKSAEVLSDAAMTLPDGSGKFVLYDFYGNPQPAKGGKIVVPLDGLGYFLRTDGSKGSFARLVEAIRDSRIEGYEPVDIVAHDFCTRIESHPTLRLTLTNVLNRPIRCRLAVKLGRLTLDAGSSELNFQAQETKEVELKITGGVPVASNTYRLTATLDAGPDGRCAGRRHARQRDRPADDPGRRRLGRLAGHPAAADPGFGQRADDLTEKPGSRSRSSTNR